MIDPDFAFFFVAHEEVDSGFVLFTEHFGSGKDLVDSVPVVGAADIVLVGTEDVDGFSRGAAEADDPAQSRGGVFGFDIEAETVLSAGNDGESLKGIISFGLKAQGSAAGEKDCGIAVDNFSCAPIAAADVPSGVDILFKIGNGSMGAEDIPYLIRVSVARIAAV